MTNELLSLLSFTIGIAAYSVSQKAQHGQLRWSDPNKPYGFWGVASHVRKYRHIGGYRDVAVRTPYYKFIGSPWIEAWPTSTWLTVALTDGYHLMQFLFFIFISLSVVPLLNWNYGIAFWILAHVIHFILYRTLQR